MRGDYAALLGPTGVASHAMWKKKRPTNHDEANLPTAGKKIDLKPYKQYNKKIRIWTVAMSLMSIKKRIRGWPTTKRGGGLTSDATVSDPASDACCISATPPGYHGGRKWPVAIWALGGAKAVAKELVEH